MQKGERKMTVREAHQAFAAGLYNYTWDLLEKKDRTPEDDEMMINTAHSSLYHWSRIGTPENIQNGEWMCSHVYTILKRPEAALHHAKICVELTEKHKIGDFRKGFAFECFARALALNGRKEESEKYYKMAKEAGQEIKKKEDKDYFLQVLDEGPWFGMK